MLPFVVENVTVPMAASSALLLFSVALVGYSGWSWWSRRHRGDLLYAALGIYLVIYLLPILNSLVSAPGTCPLGPDLTTRLLRISPAFVLLLLAEKYG